MHCIAQHPNVQPSLWALLFSILHRIPAWNFPHFHVSLDFLFGNVLYLKRIIFMAIVSAPPSMECPEMPRIAAILGSRTLGQCLAALFPNFDGILCECQDALLILFQLRACECLPFHPISHLASLMGTFAIPAAFVPLAGFVRRPLAIGLRPPQHSQNIDYRLCDGWPGSSRSVLGSLAVIYCR